MVGVQWLPQAAEQVGLQARVDTLTAEAPPTAGPSCSPTAGGPAHYAACLANTDGFEVELVAAKD